MSHSNDVLALLALVIALVACISIWSPAAQEDETDEDRDAERHW